MDLIQSPAADTYSGWIVTGLQIMDKADRRIFERHTNNIQLVDQNILIDYVLKWLLNLVGRFSASSRCMISLTASWLPTAAWISVEAVDAISTSIWVGVPSDIPLTFFIVFFSLLVARVQKLLTALVILCNFHGYHMNECLIDQTIYVFIALHQTTAKCIILSCSKSTAELFDYVIWFAVLRALRLHLSNQQLWLHN